MRRKRSKKKVKKVDRKLLFLVIGLTLVGLVAVADASAPVAIRDFSNKYHFVKQQLVWAGIGISGMIVVAKINYKFWMKIASPLFYVSVIFLILVLIPGFGSELMGAKRWLVLGPVFFQPSELMKLAMIIYLARVSQEDSDSKRYFIPILTIAFLVMLEPDLGTTMVLVSVGLLQTFIGGVGIFQLTKAVAMMVLTGGFLALSSEYRRNRLITFFKQTQDPLGRGYHIRQILLALGAGGFWGVGLGHSRQKYLFLPETASDSIFAVLAEELGFVGSSILIAVFMFLIIRCLKISKNAPDTFSKVLSAGYAGWIGFQAFLNIGSMLAIVPLTGMPLPFVSYGGSSLVTVLVGAGILLNISSYQNEK